MIPDWIFDLVVMELEGGHATTDDPDDPGGLTKYGISQRAHPELDIRNLTKEQAKQVYFHEYWNKAACEKLPEYMRLSQFNCAVNCGQLTAVKCLQRVVGAKADGLIGPQTTAKIKRYGHKPRMFTTWYMAWICMYYVNVAHRRKTSVKYLKGWFRRSAIVVWETAVRFGRRV